MKTLTTSLLLLTTILVVGCGGVNLQDGTWSSCNYTKPNGAVYTGPVKLSGVPLAYTKPDGTKVSCTPIPAAPQPE